MGVVALVDPSDEYLGSILGSHCLNILKCNGLNCRFTLYQATVKAAVTFIQADVPRFRAFYTAMSSEPLDESAGARQPGLGTPPRAKPDRRAGGLGYSGGLPSLHAMLLRKRSCGTRDC